MNETNIKVIALGDCLDRHVYRLHSRNLSSGVFVEAREGFIGIREKFDSRYLFTEYHYDTGAPYGTAHPYEDLGEIPKEITATEDLGTEDEITKREVSFDKPIVDGGKGWYFVDTGEASKDIRPQSRFNKALFDYLDKPHHKEVAA